MTEPNNKPNSNLPEEQEIDLMELARKVWASRMLVLKCCGIAVIVAIIAIFSIPKEYTTTVTLAPEISGNTRSLGNMGALAAMAGLRTSSASNDALSPELYPDIVASTSFAVDLFNIPVEDAKGELHTTVYDYLTQNIRTPWWSTIMGLPSRCIGWISSLFKSEEAVAVSDSTGVNTFQLTPAQSGVVGTLNSRIQVTVDKKSWLITLSVTMQDPLISATLTDSVMQKLQGYIVDYRTNKARKDLEFTQKLYNENQANYYRAQQIYARFVDNNQDLTLRSAEAQEERLRNEMTLAYNVYNTTAQQLELAKAKVQENTPIFTVVQPATVPLAPSKPSKMMILAAFIFLAGAGSVGWILFGRELVGQLIKKGKKE